MPAITNELIYEVLKSILAQLVLVLRTWTASKRG